MSIKPYPSRTKLVSQAREDGLVVSTEGGRTTIDSGTLALSFDSASDITDGAGKSYTAAEAFDALGVAVR